MSEPSTQISGLDSDDPSEALRAIGALRQRLGREEAIQVRRARLAGRTWASIAEALGVTRQAVHKKYAAGRRDRKDR